MLDTSRSSENVYPGQDWGRNWFDLNLDGISHKESNVCEPSPWDIVRYSLVRPDQFGVHVCMVRGHGESF